MTDDLAAFIATGKPGEIAALVAGLDDAGLERLITDRTRAATVEAIVGRLPDFAIDERVLDVAALVRFAVTDGKHSDEYDVRFDHGEVVVSSAMPAVSATGPATGWLSGSSGGSLPDGDEPRATVELAAVDLARLVTGNANAAIAVLDGRLKVTGDEAFAAELAGFFAVPGGDGPAVDPATLDAAEVARIVSKAKDDHLRRIMSGGFRGIVLDEVFRRFPDYLDRERAGKLAAAIVWKITGRPDGGADRFLIRIADGTCTVSPDPEDGSARDATITIDGVDFLKLVTGNLNPMLGVLRGKLRIAGDLAIASALNSV